MKNKFKSATYYVAKKLFLKKCNAVCCKKYSLIKIATNDLQWLLKKKEIRSLLELTQALTAMLLWTKDSCIIIYESGKRSLPIRTMEKYYDML